MNFIKTMTFKETFPGEEAGSHADSWGKSISDPGNHGSEVIQLGACLSCSKNSKEASMAGGSKKNNLHELTDVLVGGGGRSVSPHRPL